MVNRLTVYIALEESKMNQLSGRRVVITGSSDGIGFGIATAFARNGANLWLVARNQDKLMKARETLQNYDVDVNLTSADLFEVGAAEQLAKEINAAWDEIHVLVNNAGTGRFRPFLQVKLEELDLQLNLNVRAPYLLTQNLLPGLIQAKGCIINISSYFAQRMLPDRPSTAYSLTKGALNSFTKALAYELGPLGVRVNAIAPGSVNTPIFQKNLSYLSPDEKTRFYELINMIYPLGRIGDPEDLGGIAVYLASDEAKWVTGAIFNIDGGLTTN